jgi:hypothetical protein
MRGGLHIRSPLTAMRLRIELSARDESQAAHATQGQARGLTELARFELAEVELRDPQVGSQ